MQSHERVEIHSEDDISSELAVLEQLLAAAGDAEVAADELASIELLRDEGAITTPRPRYERRGPTLARVAAAGLATFPAAIAAMPGVAAAAPLQPDLALAMATRPPAPPAVRDEAKDLFPFTPSMQTMRARAQLGLLPKAPSMQAAGLAHLGVPHVSSLTPASKAIASPLQLDPRLKRMFREQRKVAITTKRQLASTVYQVSQGDTLYAIAQDLLGNGSRWREIYQANKTKIAAGYVLRPGQRLTIPSRRDVPDVRLAHFRGQPANSPAPGHTPRYMVARGDSLYAIAARRLHNANRWREIVALNKAILNGKTVIYPNQWLTLPSIT